MARRAVSSRDLGIDLRPGTPRELFKWFLACLLFGKPIQQTVAARTYFEFVRERLVTPRALLESGWDRLVAVLDRGHYVRYDFSTATKLLDVCRALTQEYGTLENLLRQSTDRADAAGRLQMFKGVGPTTTRIFLRELGPAWIGPGRGRRRGRLEAARRDRHPRKEQGMPRRSRPVRRPRSPKAGRPPEEVTSPTRVRRRAKTAHAAVRKDTTLFEAAQGPRVLWGRTKPKVKKG